MKKDESSDSDRTLQKLREEFLKRGEMLLNNDNNNKASSSNQKNPFSLFSEQEIKIPKDNSKSESLTLVPSRNQEDPACNYPENKDSNRKNIKDTLIFIALIFITLFFLYCLITLNGRRIQAFVLFIFSLYHTMEFGAKHNFLK